MCDMWTKANLSMLVVDRILFVNSIYWSTVNGLAPARFINRLSHSLFYGLFF